MHDDVADLAALVARTRERAHVLGNSFGASIALRLAATRPELVRTLNAHEPPLFDLLRDDPLTRPLAEELDDRIAPVLADLDAGRLEEGARRFIDTVALWPGAWDGLPDEVRRTLAANGPTFLEECCDPERLTIDLAALARVACPVFLSNGSESPTYFAPVLNRLAAVLPHARRHVFAGMGHVPHVTHPAEYVRATLGFLDDAAS